MGIEGIEALLGDDDENRPPRVINKISISHNFVRAPIITADNIPELAKVTGKSEEELREHYLQAKAEGKQAFILLEAMFTLPRDNDVPEQ
jgi:hypothetical protein